MVIRFLCVLAVSAGIAGAADTVPALNYFSAPTVEQLRLIPLRNALHLPQPANVLTLDIWDKAADGATQLEGTRASVEFEPAPCAIPLTRMPIDGTKDFKMRSFPVESADSAIAKGTSLPACK